MKPANHLRHHVLMSGIVVVHNCYLSSDAGIINLLHIGVLLLFAEVNMVREASDSTSMSICEWPF